MASLQKGDLLSRRYRVQELLGEGAMGRVYLAEDTETGAEVAVKVLKPESGSEPSLLTRFEREIQTLRRLDHPHILRYVDHGRHGDLIYLAVERLKGRTLEELGAEFLGRVDKVAMIGALLGRAFAAAHQQGVIHRDIKPGNILLTAEGEPRILDYGLARWEAPEGVSPDAIATMERLTQTNALLGTIPYMSPEQLRAEPADRRSDIFSLSVVLFELAAGRRPYVASTFPDLVREVERGEPPTLSSLRADLDNFGGKALDIVLRRGLDPIPRRRYHAMDELARALEGVLETHAIPEGATAAILLPPPSLLADAAPRTLFGREREMGLFEDAFARGGQGGAYMVQGTGGIGKSLLLSEVGRLAHARGLLVIPASASPDARDLSFDPALTWLKRLGEIFPSAPEVAAAMNFFASAQTPPRVEAEAVSVRADRIVSALAGLSSRVRILLTLEDAHNAAPEMIELLGRLADLDPGTGLVLALTARTELRLDPARDEALRALSARPRIRTLALSPLDGEALSRLAEEIYPGLVLTETILAALLERSGGIPAYAIGILAQLEKQGDLIRERGEWVLRRVDALPDAPGALTLLHERLEGMGEEERSVLEAAAVLGHRFTSTRVAEVVGIAREQASRLLQGLERGRHLILGRGDDYRFDQPLTRDLLLQGLERERRRELNLRAARTLADRVGGGVDPLSGAAIVGHFMEAGRADEALPHAVKTGLHLHAHDAPREALPLLDAARSILERRLDGLDEAARAPLRGQLAEVSLGLGESLHALGRNSEALEHLESARGLAVRVGRPDLQARGLVAMAHVFLDKGEMLQAQRKAREAERLAARQGLEAERGLALAAEAHSLSRLGDAGGAEAGWTDAAALFESLGMSARAAEVEFRLGNHLFRLDRTEEAGAWYAKAAGRVAREENPRLYARVQNALAAIHLSSGKPALALPQFEEAASIRQSIGARKGEAASLNNIAHCHHLLGRLAKAGEIYERVISMRREMDDEAGRSNALCNHAAVLLDLGRIEQALSEVKEALSVKREIEDLVYLPYCLTLVGEIELELGRCERALEAFGQVLGEFGEHGQEVVRAHVGSTEAHWLSGNAEAARSSAELALRHFPSCHDRTLQAKVRWQVVRVLRRLGVDLERLVDVFRGAEAATGAGTLPVTRMHLDLIRSAVAMARGDEGEAGSRLEGALASARELGMPEMVWRIERDLAALQAEGSPARAEHLAEAAAIVEAQARRIESADLRSSYLSHKERSGLQAARP